MSAERVRGGAGPVITAWSAVSPYGIGRTAYAEGIRSRRPTAVTLDAEAWHSQDDQACLVPGFDVREVLGRKGTRTMDRGTGLTVTAVRELVQEEGAAAGDEDRVPAGPGTALVLGTTIGSVQSQYDFSRASFEGERPYDVPSHFMPNIALNRMAAAAAMRFGLKGPNTSLAGGRLGALHALAYARRLLAAGRADRALVGAVEEYSRVRSWLEQHSGLGGERPTLGEGCALFVMEPAGSLSPDRAPLAELLATDIRADVRGDPAATLGECVRGALEEAGTLPGEVWAAAGGGLQDDAGRAEQALLTDMFGAKAAERAVSHQLIGDTAAASGAFQLAAVLAAAAADPAAAGGIAVLTSVDRDSMVGCAVLRLFHPSGEGR